MNFRSRLVNDVNRLVWQTASGDVTIRQFDGGHDSVVGKFNVVMFLVSLSKPFDDFNRFIFGSRIDNNALETTFQSGVFLDVFAVFVQSRGADALDFSA